MLLFVRAARTLRSLHWGRGLRAGVAVASAMVVCRMLKQPMGWAALGGFEAVLVDNGGPYRSRLNTIATVLFGGALCGLIGSLLPREQGLPVLVLGVAVTAAVCFAVTFARVASQPIASTSVIILVLYFAGFGSAEHTLAGASRNVLAYILGGVGAAVLSLFLWPIDPFRPARLEVAACYDLLASFTRTLHQPASAERLLQHDDDYRHATEFKRRMRMHLEAARAALGTSAARAPARTIRARNLSVLLETADMLLAITLRLIELAEVSAPAGAQAPPAAIGGLALWLSGAESAIAAALLTRPRDNADSFAPQGSHTVQHVSRRAALLAEAMRTWTEAVASGESADSESAVTLPHLLNEERSALQNIEIAFEAVRALWTGVELRRGLVPTLPGRASAVPAGAAWLASLRDNWSLDSVMMRHALRMAVVGAVDVVLLRALNVPHGFWLAMTSIIVLQPYRSGTVRKSLERVGGTIAGGIVAALLAAVIHSYTLIIVVITVTSVLTLATYAIDYGWYSFFLTPTFVLMSLPQLRDWRYAGVRMMTTLLGAFTAVVAMRVLWPQSLDVELGRLLARCAEGSAAYARAVLAFWGAPPESRAAADRAILAPARRACGLTSQDAEEALDRVLLEPLPARFSHAGRTSPATESSLTFTTYIRRFTQCLTTLAAVGRPSAQSRQRVETLSRRLDHIQQQLLAGASAHAHQQTEAPQLPIAEAHDPAEIDDSAGLHSLAAQMLQRMERQAGVLERAASSIVQLQP